MELVIKIGIGFYSLLYAIFKVLPVQKKVTFLSRQSNKPSLDFRLLSSKITELHPDYRCEVLCQMIEPGIAAKIGYCFHMIKQAYHIATSKCVVLDSYSILVSCLHHRDSLLVVQMWHSVGTMKKFGYSILNRPEGSSSVVAHALHMHENYDYMLASSDAYKAHLAEGFHQPVSKIVTLALPRVELLKDPEYKEKTRARILKKYPSLGDGKRNIVYAPTFRKEAEEKEPFRKALQSLVSSIDKDQYNLVLKLHPLYSEDLEVPGAITDRSFSTFDMFFIADLVISDYSCAIYEAAVLHLPLYFYAYDYDEYMSIRDIYMDYDHEVPGPICRTAEELAAALEEPYDMERLRAFTDKYVSPENYDETRRIAEFLFDHMK